MKYKIIFLILLISACKHKSTIDQNIEDYMLKNAHNPDSYEPISTKPIDTTTEAENLIYLIKSKISAVQSDSSGIQYQKEFINSDSLTLYNDRIDYQKELNSYGKNFATSGSYPSLIQMGEKKLDEDNKTLTEKKKEIQKDKEELKTLESKFDSIKKSPNSNSIYAYHFIHQCRVRVPLGGMMLKNIFIETDKNFNIKMFEEGK